MEFLIIGSILLILAWLISYHYKKGKSAGEMEQIRSAWGKPKSNSFHFVSIGKYADEVKEKFHRLTDQTIQDIDIHQLFVFIDRSTSKVGQQFLFKKVIEPTNLAVDPSEPLVQLFTRDAKLREEIQLELQKLNDHDAYYIPTLLREDLLEKPKWHKLLILDIILVLCLLLLSIEFPGLLIFLIFPITLNMFLHIYNKNNTFQFSRSIPQLNLLINVSKTLIKKKNIPFDKSVAESISHLKLFQKKASLVRFSQGGVQADFTQYLFDIIKVFFLIEVMMVYRVIEELKNKRSSIITLFDYVGNLDASISIASLRAGDLKTCQPTFTTARKEIKVSNIYHPLIKNCVTNSLEIRNRSILITGSNMSGKSTFLRTLAINSILAQTVYTCFADEYCTPVVKQFSSIRIDDSLFEGKSYYFQEVSTMASLIAEVNLSHQNLFILDEVFKGTNTVERIAAAKAILSYLNRKENIVVVSTHDLELAEMLSGEYDLYHFTETVENNNLHFDHLIKPGQLGTKNAIRILELADYPADIISEAKQISASLRTAK